MNRYANSGQPEEIKDETELEELKKNLKRLFMRRYKKEVDQIVSSAFKGKDKHGHMDIESLEMRIRSSMHGIGSIMLEKLLNTDGGDYRGNSIACDNGHMYEFMGYRDKELLTVLGEVKIRGHIIMTGNVMRDSALKTVHWISKGHPSVPA